MPYTAPATPTNTRPEPVALRLSADVPNVWRDRRKSDTFNRLQTLPAGAFVAYWPAWVRLTDAGREVEAMEHAALVLPSGTGFELPHTCRAEVLQACDLSEPLNTWEVVTLHNFSAYNAGEVLQTMMEAGALTPSALAGWIDKTRARWDVAE